MLRVMIVDDEELSIKRLSRILTESLSVGECHTFLVPSEAYEYAKRHPIDIAFLDISMPETSGMNFSGLLKDLDEEIDIVFVTGHDSYAVEAFERSALDYLLKPVMAERVAMTLEKARMKRRNFGNSSELEVRMFNGFRILRPDKGNEALKLRSPKTEELFAFLLCKKYVSREEIADTLWSGLDPDKAMKNLNSTLYYIRKAIGERKTGPWVIGGKNELRIEEGDVVCDMYQFDRLLLEMRRTPEHCDKYAKRAEEIYSGPLLGGKAYEWAGEYARRLEQGYIRLLEGAAQQHRDRKEPLQALHYFGEIMKMDVLREDIALEMILLWVELGRPHEALKLFQVLEVQLKQELGVLPGRQIRELIQSLV
ncbi:response regulator [Paenibacillus timonensis]|uniref:response regulator n=1 Tax=Paenibacillus timonensis TaxID=225915 RepID=UPI003F9CB1F4